MEIVQVTGFKKVMKDIQIDDSKTMEELQDQYFNKEAVIFLSEEVCAVGQS